ncbi:hypothetical protein B7463_g5230, partial [Scytalidium lignicola]
MNNQITVSGITTKRTATVQTLAAMLIVHVALLRQDIARRAVDCSSCTLWWTAYLVAVVVIATTTPRVLGTAFNSANVQAAQTAQNVLAPVIPGIAPANNFSNFLAYPTLALACAPCLNSPCYVALVLIGLVSSFGVDGSSFAIASLTLTLALTLAVML